VPTVPLVTVLVAVANGERYLRQALESVLRQSLRDLELVVVDDGSTDRTPAILESISDPRVRAFRHDDRRGLAASLNDGLEHARARYLARMDADDVAFPAWLSRSLATLSSRGVGLVGSGVLDIDAAGRPGEVHVHESGPAAMRWRSLFSAPVFHDTAVLERDLLERHGLRYDTAYGESEDYDLWARLLEHAEGDTVETPLVLHRLHPAQASRLRGGLQRSLALEVSLRQIGALAPSLPSERAELVRLVALGEELAPSAVETAVDDFLGLLRSFAASGRYGERDLHVVRRAAARAVARAALRAEPRARPAVLREASRLDPLLPAHTAARRSRRRAQARTAHRDAVAWLAELDGAARAAGDPRADAAVRVAAVFPEPTPYRAPLLDRVAALDDVDLTVIYAAETVAGRTWRVEPRHRAVFLRGARLPGAERILHHDYPLTPGVVPALESARPDVVVVSGWSTFAAQAAIAWCRVRTVPYVLVVESHDEGPRAGWRKAVKGTVVPRVVRGASGVLVTGTLARRSMVARGAAPGRVHVFANTIDVQEFGRRMDGLAGRRDALREGLGAGPDDVAVLSVARLAPEKGLDVLVHAVAEAGDPRILLVLAGDGPERERLDDLARVRGVRLLLTGDLEWERIVEVYAAADVFALLSEREPWAVVVNEAAACGLPLVLSDRVGAAHDLLRDGENGVLVAAGDVDAASEALRRLADDPGLRRAWGARSREIAQDWGYGPSVEGFAAAVREAAAARPG
jgi:glycosyltransferase involved in cell wall biosynthesis